MKKQIRLIAVALVCIILLGCAWFLLSDDDGAEETSAAPASEEKTVLWQQEKDAVKSVCVSNENGGYTALWENGALSVEALEGLPLDESAVSVVLSDAASVSAEQRIADGESRLADFGLDRPAGEVSVTFVDEKEFKLSLGSSVPGSEKASHYVRYDGSVYVVYDTYLKAFFYGEEDLISHQVTPDYDSSSDSFVVENVSVSGSGFPEAIALERVNSQQISGYQVNTYQLTAPLTYPANASNMETYLYSFFNLTAEKVAAVRPEDAELAAYGLNEPWARVELTYKDNEGVVQSLVFSLSEAADGSAYCMVDGVPAIYQCSMSDAAWASMDVDALVSREVMAPSLRSLRSLSIQGENGETAVLELRMEDGSDAYQVFCGGEELDVESFKNYYYTLISQSADEVLFDELPSTEAMKLLAVVTYEYQDEAQEPDVVTYYQESERQLYVEINEAERGCRISNTQLQQMLERLDQLLAGEKVEARY